MKTLELVESILDPAAGQRAAEDWGSEVRGLTDAEYRSLIESLAAAGDRLADPSVVRTLERALPSMAARQVALAGSLSWMVPALTSIYLHTPAHATLRHQWLGWLAQLGSVAALEAWLDLIRESPPQNREGIIATFGPLVNRSDLPEWFYSRLLAEVFPHGQFAAATLDLINFHVRRQRRSPHPATPHRQPLMKLLHQIGERLSRVEQGKYLTAMHPEQMQHLVSDSVALVVSLCDTLALVGDESAIDVLRQTMQLRHRRIQTEAAAALARLGDDGGRQRLIELAAEPMARQRVLAYAEELGLHDFIDDEHRSDAAVAEAQLAVWLAEPQQVGMPPSRLELLDHRELYWPGFDHPVGVFLFRYYYGTGPDATSNIGIVGPMVYAFERDVSGLSLDDVLAAFAGWQAVHDDIYEVALGELVDRHPQLIEVRERRLRNHDFVDVQWQFAGCMMGEWILVGSARLGGEPGFVMIDEQRVNWFAADAEQDVTPEWAYMVYRGRRMLRAFNDQLDPSHGWTSEED